MGLRWMLLYQTSEAKHRLGSGGCGVMYYVRLMYFCWSCSDPIWAVDLPPLNSCSAAGVWSWGTSPSHTRLHSQPGDLCLHPLPCWAAGAGSDSTSQAMVLPASPGSCLIWPPGLIFVRMNSCSLHPTCDDEPRSSLLPHLHGLSLSCPAPNACHTPISGGGFSHKNIPPPSAHPSPTATSRCLHAGGVLRISAGQTAKQRQIAPPGNTHDTHFRNWLTSEKQMQGLHTTQPELQHMAGKLEADTSWKHCSGLL